MNAWHVSSWNGRHTRTTESISLPVHSNTHKDKHIVPSLPTHIQTPIFKYNQTNVRAALHQQARNVLRCRRQPPPTVPTHTHTSSPSSQQTRTQTQNTQTYVLPNKVDGASFAAASRRAPLSALRSSTTMSPVTSATCCCDCCKLVDDERREKKPPTVCMGAQ